MPEIPAALGLDGPAEPMTGGQVSRVWRARRDGADVVVRQSPWFRTPSEVEYELAVLRVVQDAGLPVAAPIDVVEDGSVWTVFEWVDGVPVTAAVDASSLGALLAELHEVTATLVGTLGQRPRWCRADQFLTHPRADGDLSLEAVLPDFERKEGVSARRLGAFARAVHERLVEAGCDLLPQVVVHGDFAPHQLLRRADGVFVVLDWDFCHLDLRVADVAFATSFCRPSMARVGSYVGAYDAIGRLGADELELLGDLRRAFHLNNLANYLCTLWVAGVDVSANLAIQSERLEREQWWGPMIVEGARRRRDRAPVRTVETDLDVAHELADRAAVVAMHWFDAGVDAEMKADSSPVTDADRAVELLLRHSLAELRPDDAILGEEFGQEGTSSRTWIIDPIDGTNFFAAGSPYWRVQLALEVDGEIVATVVDAPALGLRWSATRGGGTIERGADGVERRLAVSTTTSLADSVVIYYPHDVLPRLPPEVQPKAWDRFPLPEVLRGEVEAFFVDCCEVWDHAPWVLLVEEAGGRFTDHEGGRSPAKRGGLYSNRAVHDALLEAIKPPTQ